MKPPTYPPADSFSSGYSLFKRGDTWHVRFSIKGQGQFRHALETKDEHVAELLAKQKWHEACLLAQHGIPLKTKLFAAVADEFIEQLEHEVERGQRAGYQAKLYPPVIRKYFVGRFGSRPFASLRSADIEAYWEWRRDYWTTGPGSKMPFIRYQRTIKGRTTSIRRPIKEGRPSDSTLSKEALLLKQLFRFALRREYTREEPIIEFGRSKRRKPNSRPDFTLDEFQLLLKTSEQRVWEQHINGHLRNDRCKLHAFCSLAGFTGMRPTEMFNLTWGDIEPRQLTLKEGLQSDILILHARGKGKEREVATMPEILTPLNLLKNVFMMEVGREPGKTDPVFVNASGTRIRTFKHGLNSLLDAAGLMYASDGRKRDSFSFRHFYITQQLRAGVHHHLLAMNAGTSTAMIDAFYSKIRPTEEVTKLAPDWFGQRLPI